MVINDVELHGVQCENTEYEEQVFSKEQILASKRYFHSKDLIFALLDNDKTYAFCEIDEILNEFMKGAVE